MAGEFRAGRAVRRAAVGLVRRSLPETLARRDPHATRPKVIVANYGRLLRSRAFSGYMLVAAFGFSGLFAFLAGSAFVFVSVLGESEQGFGVLFGAVMLGNITGSTIGSRLVRRAGIERMVRAGTSLMLAAGLTLGALRVRGNAASARRRGPDVRLHGGVHADDAAGDGGCADAISADRRQRVVAARRFASSSWHRPRRCWSD